MPTPEQQAKAAKLEEAGMKAIEAILNFLNGDASIEIHRRGDYTDIRFVPKTKITR